MAITKARAGKLRGEHDHGQQAEQGRNQQPAQASISFAAWHHLHAGLFACGVIVN